VSTIFAATWSVTPGRTDPVDCIRAPALVIGQESVVSCNGNLQ